MVDDNDNIEYVELVPTSIDVEIEDIELIPVLDTREGDFELIELVPLPVLEEANHASRSHSSQRRISKLVAGIDDDIKHIFLNLAPDRLQRVFIRYGREFGISKLIYAKNTYPHWKSGHVSMSGMVVARLLNLVPTELDAATQYELVKKLRYAYLRKEHLELSCDTSNWFKKIPPVVEALVSYSNQFQLPPEVLEKLDWLLNGDAVAAHELLAAAEIDEAKVRTQFLEREYARLSHMLSQMQGVDCINHSIELPQGTVAVTIKRPPLDILKRIPLVRENQKSTKRTLLISCKNPLCRAELETKLRAYDGEPVFCAPGEITCTYCGTSHLYDETDLSRTRKNLNVEIRKGLFGSHTIAYDCPLCGTRLRSPLTEAGTSDTCPNCRAQFVVPRC